MPMNRSAELVAALAIFTAGCAAAPDRQTRPTPNAIPPIIVSSPPTSGESEPLGAVYEVDWNKTSEISIDRFCKVVSCDTDVAKKLASNVRVLSADEFVDQVEIEQNRKIAGEARERTKLAYVEIATSRGIFINPMAFDDLAIEIEQKQPELTQRTKPIPLKQLLAESLLIHAFTHTFEPGERKINPVSITVADGTFTIDSLNMFMLVGQRSDGKRGSINGFNEAITERAAQIIGSQTGIYITLTGAYNAGAKIIAALNQAANVSDRTFLSHVMGETNPDDLLRTWGRLSRDPNADPFTTAIYTGAAIGFGVDGVLPLSDLKTSLESSLNVTFK